MKKISAVAASTILLLTFAPLSTQAQCLVKLNGIPTVGSTFRAKSFGTNVQALIWQKDGTTVLNSYRRDVSPKAITVAGGTGSGSTQNQLSGPGDVFVDAQGNVYIMDTYNARVQKWAPGATSGVTVAGGNGIGSAANQLFFPQGFFIDETGNIYIADLFNNRVQKWAPGAVSGVTVAGGNGYGSAANQLATPRDVFVDKTGNVYITDADNNRIQKWEPGALSGITVAGGNGYGKGNNQFDGPQSLFLDSTGNLFVSDRANDRIQKWAPGATSGITVASGIEGGDSTSLNNPKGIYVNKDGIVYISDYFNHRIQKWVPGMNYGITVAGGKGVGKTATKLYTPSALFMTPSGDVFVSDEGNNRIQRFTAASAINPLFIPATPGTYRVIAIFANGCTDTSNEITIAPVAAISATTADAIKGINTGGIAAFPNPAASFTRLSFSAATAMKAQVVITDMQGRIVQKQQLQAQPGLNTVLVDLSRMRAGMYLAGIEGEGLKGYVKIFKE